MLGEPQVHTTMDRIRPPGDHHLLTCVEMDAFGTVDRMAAEDRVLPSAEAVEAERNRDRNVDPDHPDLTIRWLPVVDIPKIQFYPLFCQRYLPDDLWIVKADGGQVENALLNLAMVTSLIPVIGLPLPFLSAGGSAMLTNLAGIGVLLNISATARRARSGSRWGK